MWVCAGVWFGQDVTFVVREKRHKLFRRVRARSRPSVTVCCLHTPFSLLFDFFSVCTVCSVPSLSEFPSASSPHPHGASPQKKKKNLNQHTSLYFRATYRHASHSCMNPSSKKQKKHCSDSNGRVNQVKDDLHVTCELTKLEVALPRSSSAVARRFPMHFPSRDPIICCGQPIL